MAGADMVIIPAGVPRKSGTAPDGSAMLHRQQLFAINAGIVRDLTTAIAKNAPKAFILVISNPMNSTVAVAAEVLKANGVFDAKRLFGVTTLDTVRAETFVAGALGKSNPADIGAVEVVGGHSGVTIVPLFSHLKHKVADNQLDALVNRVQYGGDEVLHAKEGAGSATLSMAYAGYRFAESVISAHLGKGNVVENTYLHLEGVSGGDALAKATGCSYFAAPVHLGRDGATKIVNPLANITEKEKVLLERCYEELRSNIDTAVDFVKNPPPAKI